MPDFVAEVNAPSDTIERIPDKIEAHLKVGVRLIWSIYMLDKFVVVYRAGELDVETFNRKGELEGGEVLPGFKLKIHDLFYS